MNTAGKTKTIIKSSLYNNNMSSDIFYVEDSSREDKLGMLLVYMDGEPAYGAVVEGEAPENRKEMYRSANMLLNFQIEEFQGVGVSPQEKGGHRDARAFTHQIFSELGMKEPNVYEQREIDEKGSVWSGNFLENAGEVAKKMRRKSDPDSLKPHCDRGHELIEERHDQISDSIEKVELTWEESKDGDSSKGIA